MNPLDHPEADHQRIVFRRDEDTGLEAIIALHDTTLGPAIGGCRIMPYPTRDDALRDVLRLSRGMTYKCAIAGIPYGGGKAVIIADPATQKDTMLLHAMGRMIDELGGEYISSFDAGTTIDDVRTMGEVTRHVAGIAEGFGNASESTAQGVLHCMEACWRKLDGGSLKDVRVAIQGMGNVGARLARLLQGVGATIVVSDVHQRACEAFDVEIIDPVKVHASEVDILAPCAFGGVLNKHSIPEINARLIVGGANNQLGEASDAQLLRDHGILYCPDFLANAGGIVELHHQLKGGSKDKLSFHLKSLGFTAREIVRTADERKLTTDVVAKEIVDARIMRAKK
ncbi:MAG: Glu/Leu/Phe/Val dehydrogenase dimerization domain-containing protein [Pseudomonadota bacterium]